MKSSIFAAIVIVLSGVSTHALALDRPSSPLPTLAITGADAANGLNAAPSTDWLRDLNAASEFPFGGSLEWVEQKVLASDGAPSSFFGTSVAISGQTAVVGAPQSTIDGTANQGAVYVFTESNGVWTETAKLSPSELSLERRFGVSVALLDSKTLFVASPYARVDGTDLMGTIYVYSESGGVWSETAQIVPDDPEYGATFGYSIAVAGNALVVGAPFATVAGLPAAGAVYVFTKSHGAWTQAGKLVSNDPRASGIFGGAVALAGATVLVGAQNDYVGTDMGDVTGVVFAFNQSDGGVWTQTQSFRPEFAYPGDAFGLSIAARADGTALIGAPGSTVSNRRSQGAAYLYTASHGVWSQAHRFVDIDGMEWASFGQSVALRGNKAIVGALQSHTPTGFTSGAVFVFDGADSNWTQTVKLTASDGDADIFRFGATVGFDGHTVLSGAQNAVVGKNAQQGAAYFYTQTLNPPTATLTPASLSFTVAADETSSDTLTLANAPDSEPLTFAIAAHATVGQKSISLQPRATPDAGMAVTLSSRALHSAGSLVPAPWMPLAVEGSILFQHDDGTAEDGVGLTNSQAGGNESFGAVWINRFAVDQALTIDSISILWPSEGDVTVGMQPILLAYYDADGDGDPVNAVRLGSSDHSVTIGALDTFENYPVSFSVPGSGDVYIGFADAWGLVPGGYSGLVYPAAIDTNTSQGASYVAGQSDANAVTDTVNLGNNDMFGKIDTFGLPGNWMIRATGTASGGGGSCVGPIVDWLSATPVSGTVADGTDIALTVAVDPAAGSLVPGDYSAELCISTNDPNRALIAVPISVTVTPGAITDRIFCDGFESEACGTHAN